MNFIKTKRRYVIIIVLFLFISLFGLTRMPENGKIGYSCYDLGFEFFKEIEEGTESRLKDLGYRLVTHDQESRTDYQIKGCLKLLESDIKALIISPINPKVLPPIVESAHKKNIPVIINDIGGGNSNYDAMIKSDDITGGRMAAEYLYDAVTSAKGKKQYTVCIMRNTPTIQGAFSRGSGFREVAEEKDWTIYDVSGEGEEAPAYREMKELLLEVPEINAVFCTNDPMAIGVLRACEELARTDIQIIGYNADISVLKEIKSGQILATVQQYPFAMGEICADVVDMILKNQTIDFDIKEDRLVLMPVTIIDKQNVEQALAALH